MPGKLRIGFFVHSLRSDWNNGNAHFLRGLIRGMIQLGHAVTAFEREDNWSLENLRHEGSRGQASLEQFAQIYADIPIELYPPKSEDLRSRLRLFDILIVHEWNPPELIETLLALRDELGFRAIFHDTHHRASSSPEGIRSMRIACFDGVLVFGESLRRIYQETFGINRVWTLHEAADATVFFPRTARKTSDVVWIGNWGDEERSRELREFLIRPAARIRDKVVTIYGVRYPEKALDALSNANIRFGGYLPNLEAPAVYASTRLTIHIPRQQYTGAMEGIPTIRVFEALASGIPLISAPWQDTEQLFRPGDFCRVNNESEMIDAIEYLLKSPKAAEEQAGRGLATVLDRHTCTHRAAQLTQICEEVLAQ